MDASALLDCDKSGLHREWRLFLQPPQLLGRACEARMLGVADIELIPTRRVATAQTAKQELDPNPQSLDESERPDDIFGHDVAAPPLLDTNFLQPAERLIVCCEHLAAEQPFEAHLMIVRWARRVR
jgi:hypothetical protein